MSDFPRSLIEFQQRFSGEGACAKYLFAARWPQGFVCPGCGTSKAWELQTKPWTWECFLSHLVISHKSSLRNISANHIGNQTPFALAVIPKRLIMMVIVCRIK